MLGVYRSAVPWRSKPQMEFRCGQHGFHCPWASSYPGWTICSWRFIPGPSRRSPTIWDMFLSGQMTVAQEGMSHWASALQSFSCQIHKLPIYWPKQVTWPNTKSKVGKYSLSTMWMEDSITVEQRFGSVIQSSTAPGTALVQASALDNKNILLGDLPSSSLAFPNLAATRVIFFFSPALLPIKKKRK